MQRHSNNIQFDSQREIETILGALNEWLDGNEDTPGADVVGDLIEILDEMYET